MVFTAHRRQVSIHGDFNVAFYSNNYFASRMWRISIKRASNDVFFQDIILLVMDISVVRFSVITTGQCMFHLLIPK